MDLASSSHRRRSWGRSVNGKELFVGRSGVPSSRERGWGSSPISLEITPFPRRSGGYCRRNNGRSCPRKQGSIQKIDFEIRLMPQHDDTRLGGSEDDKGYGGFSSCIRMLKDLTIDNGWRPGQSGSESDRLGRMDGFLRDPGIRRRWLRGRRSSCVTV